MALADLLLHVDTYPEPTPPEALDEAMLLAGRLGGKVTALALHVSFPVKTNLLAEQLIGLTALATQESRRSLEASRSGLARVSEAALQGGLQADILADRAHFHERADHVARCARTRDVCLIPLSGGPSGQDEVAQRVIFGSGRPALVFKAGTVGAERRALGRVAVAWDGGRHAARALADALPILTKAAEVRILTIVNEKPSATRGLGAEVVRHLARHGVSAEIDEVDADGQPIGRVLDRYLQTTSPDLLVMGAYGHTRMREMILGGATEHLLHNPMTPVFLSH